MDTTEASRPERQRLIRKLESIADLTAEERHALLALPMTVKRFDSHVDVVREYDRPSACCLILEGFLCRYKDLLEGRRQILSFHPPGDIPDLQSFHLKVMDHNLATLVPSTLAFIQHDVLQTVCDRYPGIARVLWRDTLIDAAIFREWMANLGRRNAKERITHLLCEMALRSKAVGLAVDHSYSFPVTQAELADATGLSAVHVNRVLQELKAEGVVSLRSSTVVVADWEGLKRTAGFDATYLHFDPDEGLG